MTPDKALGWGQFAAGIAAIFAQIWGVVHGMPFDVMHATVATGLAAGGYGTAVQGSKLDK